MKEIYITPRLLLDTLCLNDAAFIIELVNTPGWIKFIGNRNVHNGEEAAAYIQKILDNPNVVYRVVRTKDAKTPIGVISFIKRPYLEHHDLGFAFLPRYAGQGYAHEAAKAVLNDVTKDTAHAKVLATTLKENTSSIRLLEKLGFRFDHEIIIDDEPLQVYSFTT